jgi:putative folate metabolism gamma-glutamate ligase
MGWLSIMRVESIKTHKIDKNDVISKILDQYIKTVEEEDIIVITSKIISIVQGRLVAKNIISKRSLVYKEADLVLETDVNPYDLYLTIKNDVLIPSAGIDESNIDGFYVLYPEDVQETAAQIWEYLKKQHNVQKLGIVITDSHTTIMRRGVTGIALGWCGFEPLYSYINKPDLCGNPLRVTQVNILDSLATAAVFVMGEGNEQTPLAIIRDAPKISFLNRIPTVEEQKAIVISMDEDLYAPLLRSANWSKIMDKR